MSRKLLLIAGSSESIPVPVPPPGPPVPATRVLNIADRTGLLGPSNTVSDTYTGQTIHIARIAATNLRLVYGNGQLTSAALSAVLKVNNGPFVPVNFGGSPSTTFTQHWERKTSDIINVTVAPGDTITIRARYSGTSAFGGAKRSGVNGTEEGTVVGDALAGAWPTVGVTVGFMPCPNMILGDVVSQNPQTWLQAGDSIVTIGFLDAALQGRAWANFALYGEAMTAVGEGIWLARYGPTPYTYATHAIVEYGTNDLGQPYAGGATPNAAATLATYKARLLNLWGLFSNSGLKTYQTTLTPGSTSTDGYATLANQTPQTYNPIRVLANDWFRDGAPLTGSVPADTGSTDPTVVRVGQPGHPLKGIVEVADSVESSRNSGKWKSPNYTDDGSHPTATGTAAMASAVSTWLPTI